MTTTSDPRLSELVAGATKDIQTLVRGEIQLAKSEVTGSVKNAGKGLGAALAAVALLLFAVLIFAFAASYGVAEGLNWPTWSGFAIIGGVLVLIAGLLAFFALRKVKKVRAPEQTIAEANKTKQAIADRHGKGVESGLVQPES
jgi:Putative Actinobacterial Holin-X, holin superfamily III